MDVAEVRPFPPAVTDRIASVSFPSERLGSCSPVNAPVAAYSNCYSLIFRCRVYLAICGGQSILIKSGNLPSLVDSKPGQL